MERCWSGIIFRCRTRNYVQGERELLEELLSGRGQSVGRPRAVKCMFLDTYNNRHFRNNDTLPNCMGFKALMLLRSILWVFHLVSYDDVSYG